MFFKKFSSVGSIEVKKIFQKTLILIFDEMKNGKMSGFYVGFEN